ncbi:hypothetical protein [Mesorhizobium sp. M1348]|uniref:hypothetical protein n=1 Tax=unclassified Mesorhizobium TaxID=325217 RepID=UPI0033366897
MAKWFESTGDSYFSHINRQSIEAVIREAKGDQAALAVKAAGKKFDDHLHRVVAHLGITTCTAPTPVTTGCKIGTVVWPSP